MKDFQSDVYVKYFRLGCLFAVATWACFLAAAVYYWVVSAWIPAVIFTVLFAIPLVLPVAFAFSNRKCETFWLAELAVLRSCQSKSWLRRAMSVIQRSLFVPRTVWINRMVWDYEGQWEELRMKLESGTEVQQFAALTIAGLKREKRLLKEISDLTSANSVMVRMRAYWALSLLNHPDVLRISDPHEETAVWLILRSVYGRRLGEVTPPLTQRADTIYSAWGSIDPDLRRLVCEALAEDGSEDAVQVLVNLARRADSGLSPVYLGLLALGSDMRFELFRVEHLSSVQKEDLYSAVRYDPDERAKALKAGTFQEVMSFWMIHRRLRLEDVMPSYSLVRNHLDMTEE